MIGRYRRLGAILLCGACACLVTACGSSSGAGSGGGSGSAGRPAGARLALTSKQRSCLKSKGVTLPTHFGGRPGGGPAGGHSFSHNGKLPKGNFPRGKLPNRGKPPTGTFPPRGGHRFRGGAPGHAFPGAAKRIKAFKACGVSFGGGGRFHGRPPATSTTG